MRTAQQVWDNTCEDPRWLDDQVAILAEIMREAFAAGFAEGIETTARGIDGHAARLASNLACPMPAAVPLGLNRLAEVAREVGVDPVAIEAAWKRSGACARPPAAATKREGAA